MITRLFAGPFALRALIVAVLFSLALGWTVYDQMQVLRHGQEIVLKTEPIDPRSLFRGHYARLRYDVSRIAIEKVKNGKSVKRRDRLHVRLEPGADGYWQVAEASSGRLTAKEGTTLLSARVRWANAKAVNVRYGIERYFAPKKKALALEKMFRDRKVPVGVIVRVAKHGALAISGLMIDGKKVYEEPVF